MRPNPAAITTFSSANLPLTGSTFVTGFPSHPKNIDELSLLAGGGLPASGEHGGDAELPGNADAAPADAV